MNQRKDFEKCFNSVFFFFFFFFFFDSAVGEATGKGDIVEDAGAIVNEDLEASGTGYS